MLREVVNFHWLHRKADGLISSILAVCVHDPLNKIDKQKKKKKVVGGWFLRDESQAKPVFQNGMVSFEKLSIANEG